jgi:signal transduction histidine kinase
MTLRRRFLLAMALLLGVHVATTALVLWSWTRALASTERQQGLAEARVEVAALGSAVREQYVHQAHTFIEGGPGHLHHGSEVEANVGTRIDRLSSLPGVDPERAAAIRRDQAALVSWFEEQVVPLARSGGLDRAAASALHERTEALTLQTTAQLDGLLAALDSAQATERARSARAVSFAGLATLALMVVGLVTVVSIGRSLARAVLAPVDELQRAALHWQPGTGSDELGEITAAFNVVVQRLAQAEAQRIESARLAALGEMSAVVAHELLNPLTVILGQTLELEPQQAAPIRDEAEHAKRIVQGLLGFARPTEQPASPVDLRAAAQEAVDRLIPDADLTHVTLSLLGSVRAEIVASPSAVRQVLDNLVRNAVQASREGEEVEVEVYEDRLEVRDRGPGVPPRVRERMYQPFVTGRVHGTGLGLAISQRIIRAAGGSLRHEDREGGGTVAVWTWGVGDG